MTKLSPWIRLEDCSVRVIAGDDPEVIASRVALIEKTPRVRIRPYSFGVYRGVCEDGTEYRLRQWPEHLDWCYGEKGNGPDDEFSKEWCDAMLKLLGYQL